MLCAFFVFIISSINNIIIFIYLIDYKITISLRNLTIVNDNIYIYYNI